MFKVKYVDSIMMLVRLDLNLIVSLFQHKCEVTETVSTTTLILLFVSDAELTIEDKYKQTMNEIEALKDHLCKFGWHLINLERC